MALFAKIKMAGRFVCMKCGTYKKVVKNLDKKLSMLWVPTCESFNCFKHVVP